MLSRLRFSATLVAVALGGPGCSDVTPWSGSIILVVDYELGLTQRGRVLYASLTAVNIGDRPLVGTADGCGWEFSAYRDPQWTSPVWSQGFEHRCTAGLEMELNIPARGSQAFGPTVIPYADILQTSGQGTYYFAARLQGGPHRWWTDRLPAGSYEILPP
jgi:hypothetical protein